MPARKRHVRCRPSAGPRAPLARVDALRQYLVASMDLVIRHGIIVDGNGGPAFVGDVGIKDGLIARIGDLADVAGVEEIDASGKHVMPGAPR